MKKTIFVICMVVVAILAISQETDLDMRMKDKIEELDKDNLTLRFFDAVTGKGIMGAEITIGEQGEFATDFEGKIKFPAELEDGFYNVNFKCRGYIDSYYETKVKVGTIMFNHFYASPLLEDDYIRIILEWNKKPRDLDAHLEKKGGYHISYHDMIVADDGSAELNHDDKNGRGPETITVKEISADADYQYYVHDYSNRKKQDSHELTESSAIVRIYGDNQLMHTYKIPPGEKGTRWSVFKIEKGLIVETGFVSN